MTGPGRTSRQADDVTQAPVAALLRRDGEWSVFRIEGGRAVSAAVDAGRNNGRSAEVLSGIGGEGRLILYPGEEIGNGTRVEPRQ